MIILQLELFYAAERCLSVVLFWFLWEPSLLSQFWAVAKSSCIYLFHSFSTQTLLKRSMSLWLHVPQLTSGASNLLHVYLSPLRACLSDQPLVRLARHSCHAGTRICWVFYALRPARPVYVRCVQHWVSFRINFCPAFRPKFYPKITAQGCVEESELLTYLIVITSIICMYHVPELELKL